MTLGVAKPPAFGRMRNHVQVIHVFCMGTLAAISFVFWTLHGQVKSTDFPVSGALLGIGALVSTSAVVIAIYLPKLSPARREDAPLAYRVQGVYLTHVMFAALIEMAGLYWGALIMILGQPLCLIGPAVALVVLAAYFPSQVRIEEELGMDEDAYDAAVARIADAGEPK